MQLTTALVFTRISLPSFNSLFSTKFWLIVCAILATHPGKAIADEVASALHEYDNFVTEAIEKQGVWTRERMQSEHLKWFRLLVSAAEGNPESAYSEEALRKSLGIANSFGDGSQTLVVVDYLSKRARSPAERARWRTEAGELFMLKHLAKRNIEHRQIAISSLSQANLDWKDALKDLEGKERTRVIGEIVLNRYWYGSVIQNDKMLAAEAARTFNEASSYFASDKNVVNDSRLAGLKSVRLPDLVEEEVTSWAIDGNTKERNLAITRLLSMVPTDEGIRRLNRIAQSVYGVNSSEYTETMSTFFDNNELALNVQSAYEIADSLFIHKKYADLFALSHLSLSKNSHELKEKSKGSLLNGAGGYLIGMTFFAGESAFQLSRLSDAKIHFESFTELAPNDSRIQFVRGRLVEIEQRKNRE